MIKNDNDIVYTTDPVQNKLCIKCKLISIKCTCPKHTALIDNSTIKAVLRLEKSHRNGKDVTVIDHLPVSDLFLKNLAQDLKKRCGTGGTFKAKDGFGIIEIQGDKREQIKKELERLGIKCK
jgi:translation initiation factor 1